VARGWDKERAVVHTVMNRLVQQTEGLIDWLKNYQLLMNDSAFWSFAGYLQVCT
jgi:bacterioferritin (cytochrome b1)